MFDFSISTQTGLSVIIIILLVWVLLAVQSMGDRILSLETNIQKTAKSSPSYQPQNITPIDIIDIPPQIFEPYNSPSFRMLDTDYSTPLSNNIQFSTDGKGWTGTPMNRNSRFSEFM